MITRESFTSNPAEVEHLIRWWIATDKFRYHRVLVRGTKADFVNDVWVRLLATFPKGKSVECSLSTIVINNCRWELSDRNRACSGHSERNVNYRIRIARRLRPTDKSEDGTEYLVENVQFKQLNNAIAKVMRTLTFREAVIIRARYGLFGDTPMNLEQIGRALKITRERVRQIESKGIAKIQHHSRAHNLIPFLDLEINKEIDE